MDAPECSGRARYSGPRHCRNPLELLAGSYVPPLVSDDSDGGAEQYPVVSPYEGRPREPVVGAKTAGIMLVRARASTPGRAERTCIDPFPTDTSGHLVSLEVLTAQRAGFALPQALTHRGLTSTTAHAACVTKACRSSRYALRNAPSCRSKRLSLACMASNASWLGRPSVASLRAWRSTW